MLDHVHRHLVRANVGGSAASRWYLRGLAAVILAGFGWLVWWVLA